MNKTIRLLACGAIAFALTSCGYSGSNPIAPSTANLASNTLQFAVGTVNLFGAANGALNVVTTYRQPSGKSAVLLSSPTLTLPAATGLATTTTAAGYDATSTVLAGPATAAEAAGTITSTSQVLGNCGLTSFGQSGGVFGLGIEPWNSTSQADCTPPGLGATGTPFQVAPYPVPLYETVAADPNAFVPWCGPPACTITGATNSVVGNGNYPTGTAGVSEGLDVFMGIAAVASGKYTLSVNVPATNGTATGGTTATASITLPAALTNLGAAAAPAYTADGSGGGTFAFVMPAGATQAYLQITDYGPDNAGAASCNGSGTGDTNAAVGNGVGKAVYYTIETTASGALTLPDTLGPGTTATPSICTAAQNTTTNGAATDADEISIQVIGFDYNAYGAQYTASVAATLTNASPSILSAGGSADMTISPAVCQQAAGACVVPLPLLAQRSPHAATFIRHK